MDIVTDNECELNFEYKVLRELPSNGKKMFYIPNDGPGIGRDGVIVKFMPPNGESWIGIFAFGDMPTNRDCVIYEGPGKDHLTINAQGEGYIVAADNPRSFEHVKSCPVFGVVSVPRDNLVLFYDYTNIVAYNENGLLWESKSISWDGIKISSISENEIIGTSWDSPNDKYVKFRVNLTSGIHQGGASSSD